MPFEEYKRFSNGFLFERLVSCVYVSFIQKTLYQVCYCSLDLNRWICCILCFRLLCCSMSFLKRRLVQNCHKTTLQHVLFTPAVVQKSIIRPCPFQKWNDLSRGELLSLSSSSNQFTKLFISWEVVVKRVWIRDSAFDVGFLSTLLHCAKIYFQRIKKSYNHFVGRYHAMSLSPKTKWKRPWWLVTDRSRLNNNTDCF